MDVHCRENIRQKCKFVGDYVESVLGLQEAVAAVLGICFRLFVDPKNPDSVVNTAATTVRQVFGHSGPADCLKHPR